MPSISPIDAAVSSSTTIGRYFAVVSVVPAALLVIYVTLLLWAGAWSGPVDLSRIGPAFRDSGLVDLGWFLAASLVVALLIHPLKFGTTQLLEGYWGASTLGLKLTAVAVKRHHRKAVRLLTRSDLTQAGWVVRGSALWRNEEPAPDPSTVRGSDLDERGEDALRGLSLPSGEGLLAEYVAHQAYDQARASYPGELRRIMPTRLGNVLRESEDRAGKQYGLDTMVIAPHLSLVAKPEHYAYVQDRQKAMDLAITMCLVGALATGVSAVLLTDDGWWTLFAFVPFGVAYGSYLGAVAAARSYNVAIETVTDLSRFALYDALHVAQPTTGMEERQMAKDLMEFLRGTPWPEMKLVHPEPPPTTATISFRPGTPAPPVSGGPPVS
jgi:hypothetical protein